jgi:hypothetical protein
MIVVVKDDLKMQVTVFDERVSIAMPEMEDVIILWSAWIRQEEKLAEIFLKSQYVQNPYPALKNYFQEKGWEIKQLDLKDNCIK